MERNSPPSLWSALSPAASPAMKSTKWAFMAARRPPSSWKTAKSPKKTCCTRSAAATSWLSTSLTLGASCVGGSKHVLMNSSKYTKERKAFGKQIGEFGLMKEKLAEMAIQIYAVESMVYRSAGNIEAAMVA